MNEEIDKEELRVSSGGQQSEGHREGQPDSQSEGGSPTAVQAEVIALIYRLFRESGRWPTWVDVDAAIDFSFDSKNPWDIVKNLDRRYFWAINDTEPHDATQVGLSVRGLVACPAAAEDLDVFLESVAWVADQSRAAAKDLTFTAEDVTRQLDSAAKVAAADRGPLLARQSAHWQANGMFTSIGPLDTPDWRITVSRRQIREFRNLDRDSLLQALIKRNDERVALASQPAWLPPTLINPGEPLRTDRVLTASTGSSTLADVSSSEAVQDIRAESGKIYRVFPGRELGRGGQGIVYLGYDADGEAVAVKRVSLRGFDTTKWYRDARASERELLVADHLRANGAHGVLPMIDHALGSNELVYIYPLAEASLEDYLANPRAGAQHNPHEDVLRAATDLAHGLVELHARNVVHRDIKPSNALAHDGSWKWTDLGTARLVTELTSTYTLAGMITAAYAAPEVTQGEPATVKADVYSFGCVLYALATGHPPFTGSDVVVQHRSQDPDLEALERMGDRYVNVVRHCLGKDPRGRPDAQWVLDRLEGISRRRTRQIAATSTNPPGSTDDTATPAAIAKGEAVDRDRERQRRLTQMGVRGQQRSDAFMEKERDIADRRAAADAARQVFDRLFEDVRADFDEALPYVQAHTEPDTWFLTATGRRLRFTVQEPAENTCPALLIGYVWVESRDEDVKSLVANIVAMKDEQGQIVWKLLRLVGNDAASPEDRRAAKVQASYSDERGGAPADVVEKYFRQLGDGIGAKIVTIEQETALNAPDMVDLFLAEIEAIEASAT